MQSEAYDLGWASYYRGDHPSTNPFSDLDDIIDWDEGFEAAFIHELDNSMFQRGE